MIDSQKERSHEATQKKHFDGKHDRKKLRQVNSLGAARLVKLKVELKVVPSPTW